MVRFKLSLLILLTLGYKFSAQADTGICLSLVDKAPIRSTFRFGEGSLAEEKSKISEQVIEALFTGEINFQLKVNMEKFDASRGILTDGGWLNFVGEELLERSKGRVRMTPMIDSQSDKIKDPIMGPVQYFSLTREGVSGDREEVAISIGPYLTPITTHDLAPTTTPR